MEVTYTSSEDSDEFIMTLQTLSMKIDVRVNFDDKIENGFSTYTVDIFEDNVLVTSDAFVNFPDRVLLDYAPDSFNIEEVRNQFFDVSNSWHEFLSQAKIMEDRKRAFIDKKLDSGLYYE